MFVLVTTSELTNLAMTWVASVSIGQRQSTGFRLGNYDYPSLQRGRSSITQRDEV